MGFISCLLRTATIHTRSTPFCSCKIGLFGRFCKHAVAVFKFYEQNFTNRPPVTYIERHQMAVVALGQDASPPHFYRALNEKIIDDNGTITSADDQVEEPMDTASTSLYIPSRQESINPEKAKKFSEVDFTIFIIPVRILFILGFTA